MDLRYGSEIWIWDKDLDKEFAPGICNSIIMCLSKVCCGCLKHQLVYYACRGPYVKVFR
ncbi:MAG: hypothetical protein ACI9BC_001714 [Crocinitomicaceae bacterium]|jgi:hypothetical protein